MLSEYQLKIADLYNILFSNVKKNLIKKSMCFIIRKLNKRSKTKIFKTKKRHRVLEFNQLQKLKSCIEFNTKQKNRNRRK